MKFLCLSCDEGMKLETASGPHDGSLEATFVCPRCRFRVSLLTNPWETQLVEGGAQRPGADQPTGPGCPFADMLGHTEPAESLPGIRWSDAAKLRIERIPSFIRPMVQRAIERYAQEQGHPLITDGIMDEARSKLGM
jgi:hypothetical protein